ncbi:PKD domain-containing protein, partial [Flavobacterium sp.]|uniref:PKD domain-containing protein n=1 Tax=Flavobacterium sp. TaxID=239 RepID=UPI00374DA0FC
MKYKIAILFSLVFNFAFSQNEANNWYFGSFAGMQFNPDGSTTTLMDSQMYTPEGCATISSSSGQLLFYTNGIKVFDRNHQIMANGNNLTGSLSTTQCGIIALKPGSTNLYYIFTLDEQAGSNGFKYSVVDMSLNGGFGDVTSQKNIPIYNPSCEKLAIVKHPNNVDYWVVTHGWNDNHYYAHLLTATGLNTLPIISNVGNVIQGDNQNTIGYLKISPDGTKIAVIHNDFPNHINSTVELLDFDTATGIISNSRVLLYDELPYGIEFSPSSEILYQPSKRYNTIFQYNLNASDISNSRTSIYQNNIFNFSALQLGPNGKIYIARAGDTKLSVINNPDVLGPGCGFVHDGVDLNGRMCINGLPPFVSSYFRPLMQLSTSCEEENIQFTLSSNQTILSVAWDFGDGSPIQNSIIGSHFYSTPNTYTVIANVTTASGIKIVRKIITILPKPIINTIVSLKQCDDNIDGFSVFNLTEANTKISTNFVNETFSYFETANEAQNNISPIPNFTTYTNQIVSNDVVYVRVSNTNGCFRVAQLNLIVSTTQVPVTFTRTFTQCDDAISGTNTDGIAAFNFASVDTEVRNLFPVNQSLTITYYLNLADALAEINAITNISNYRNIGYANTQNMYTRVDSDLNNDCLLLKSFITLNVERIPIVSPIVRNHCDDDQDGFYGFDTTNLQTNLLNGITNVTVTYFDQNNNPLPSPLPNPFVTASQTIKVVVTNNTTKACSYETTIQFVVDDLPEAFPILTTLTTVCDDEANPINQNGLYSFDTSTFQNTILGSQTGMTVNYYDGNNNPLPSPLPNPFVTATQNVRV